MTDFFFLDFQENIEREEKAKIQHRMENFFCSNSFLQKQKKNKKCDSTKNKVKQLLKKMPTFRLLK